jgi:hypothetical protein
MLWAAIAVIGVVEAVAIAALLDFEGAVVNVLTEVVGIVVGTILAVQFIERRRRAQEQRHWSQVQETLLIMAADAVSACAFAMSKAPISYTGYQPDAAMALRQLKLARRAVSEHRVDHLPNAMTALRIGSDELRLTLASLLALPMARDAEFESVLARAAMELGRNLRSFEQTPIEDNVATMMLDHAVAALDQVAALIEPRLAELG